MPQPNEQRNLCNRVAEFYNDKTVFITGAAGYLGVVLLEILLRCCPGINRIYILLREKKGLQPECRKEVIFSKQLFRKLKEKQPEAFNKVHVVAGDVTCTDLGMSREDAFRVAQEATVVFHCAATISFLKPLRYSLLHNAVATDNVVDFCRKLKKLDVLVYTSTAYSNSNRLIPLDEIIYRLPFHSQMFLDAVRSGTDNELTNLATQCCPTWPNHYTFSKCLAENILADKASDLPVAIVRPSIITAIWKGALPGYVEEGSGMVGFCLGIGKGFIRVVRVDLDKKIDHVPADAVANTHLVAAWSVASKKMPSPLIVNCTSSELAPCTWRNYMDALVSINLKYPLPKAYQRPSLMVRKGKLSYWIFSILEHYAPAVAIDCLLWLSGRKPKLVSLYRFFDKSMETFYYFVLNEWNFRCENFKKLAKLLDSKESEMFYVDLDNYSAVAFAEVLPFGAPFYQWDIDKKRYEERMRTTYIRYMLTTFIKWLVVSCVFLLLFTVIYQIVQVCQVPAFY